MSKISESAAPAAPPAPRRIDLLDVLRGVALLAMATYHFTWDLEFFGYLDRGLTGQGGWKLFARCIASSFLFLAGVSLVLAHARGIRWRPFGKRFAQVAAGAAAITAMPAMAVTNQGRRMKARPRTLASAISCRMPKNTKPVGVAT